LLGRLLILLRYRLESLRGRLGEERCGRFGSLLLHGFDGLRTAPSLRFLLLFALDSLLFDPLLPFLFCICRLDISFYGFCCSRSWSLPSIYSFVLYCWSWLFFIINYIHIIPRCTFALPPYLVWFLFTKAFGIITLRCKQISKMAEARMLIRTL